MFLDFLLLHSSPLYIVMFDCLQPYGLYISWHSQGQNTGVGSLFLLQGSSQPLDQTQVSLIAGRFITSWATREALLYTEEMYKKDLPNPDNHDGVITHLDPDILECEVKWALGSITTNKASGGEGIPVELFQILKDDAVKVLHSICQQIWKTQQWPQD